MKQIKLINTNLCALVDDNLYAYLIQFRWYLMKVHKSFYARTIIGTKHVLMHQLVLPLDDINLTPDHINENGLDNQRDNLRPANRRQQEAHKSKIQDTSSKYKGVSWVKKYNCWRAYIKINQKQIFLGHWDSEILAAQAYNKAAIQKFGEFAKLNETNTLGILNA
jgi:hypothetical protein